MTTINDYIEDDDSRFKVESDKNLIYDSKTDKDICMYFNEETKNFLLEVLNNHHKNINVIFDSLTPEERVEIMSKYDQNVGFKHEDLI